MSICQYESHDQKPRSPDSAIGAGPTLELCLGLVGVTVIGQCSTKVLGSQVSRDAFNNFHDSSELFISSSAGLALTVCDFFLFTNRQITSYIHD